MSNNANSSAIKDAVRLAQVILDSKLAEKEWLVVTITKSEKDIELPTKDIKTTAFGYMQDDVVEIFAREIFLVSQEHCWLAKINRIRKHKQTKKGVSMKKEFPGEAIPNSFTRYAWEKGYLRKNGEEIVLWCFEGRQDYTVTFLTTREKLISFFKKYSQEKENMQYDQHILYKNGQLTFRSQDNSHISVSLKNWKVLKKVFDCFWELRTSKPPGTVLFEKREFYAIYKKNYGEDYIRDLSDNTGNIKSLVYNKGIDKDRFKFGHDKDTGKCRFELH